jgi:hypothetical protein
MKPSTKSKREVRIMKYLLDRGQLSEGNVQLLQAFAKIAANKGKKKGTTR